MSQHICTGPNCNCKKLDLKALELNAPQNDNTMEKFETTKDNLKQEIERIEKGNNYKKMVHLHLHSYHSILDGAGSIDDYIKLAKEYNHPAITILDHGTLSGTFEFFQKCTKAGIKPILGMEAYVNDKMGQFEEKKYEGGNTHQSILVKNEQGYKNINKLAYLSYTEGFYKRGRITTEMLLANKEGLIITTSCLASAISRKLEVGQVSEAEEYLKLLHKAFGDDLYAEIQFNEIYKTDDNSNYGQKEYNAFIVRMANKYGIPVILTNDVHYAKPEDNKLQDLLIAINQHSKVGEAFALDARHLYYASDKDFHEFNTKFGYNYKPQFIEQCLENTLKVAEKCNFKFDTETTKFPVYEPTPDVSSFFKTENTEEIIRGLSHGKLKQKLNIYRKKNIIGEVTEKVVQEYTDRLNYELDVIAKKGMLDYFLVYWEIIRDYRSKGYDIGPGRGSASGSLLSWCLDITKIDPIRFGLYFERFLNPQRTATPDIDVDFMTGTDHIVDEFLYKKYGKERILPVCTFSTFSEKNTLKDVVRAYRGEEATGYDSDVFQVTKEMPDFSKVEYNLKTWFEEYPKKPECTDVTKRFLTDSSNSDILKYTLQFQGQIRGIGQHAAGIVITPGPLWNYLPPNIIGKSKNLVTAFQEADKSGKDLSTLGILKLDRLKIETLNVIKDAVELIKKTKGIDVSEKVDYVDLKDKNLYAELRLGLNHGIFQFESPGMNTLIKGMSVENFDELIAANALYRPGPMGIGAHQEFIKNKFNPENISLVHPALETILEKTNGVLIYQEQLMFLANKIGALTLGDGDNLRRYMDKAGSLIAKETAGTISEEEKNNKDYKSFKELWGKFLDGAEKNGYKKEEVDKIKDWVIKYLGYSFNLSHACSYAYLAMQTLFLKHYYPTEFYTALLNHPKTSGGKEKEQAWIAAAISASISKGISIKTPSRKSQWDWTMTSEKEITMGFAGVNGFGEIAYNELMETMKQEKKTLDNISRYDFFNLTFSKFNKAAFEASVKSGVFDDWSTSRTHLTGLWESSKKKKKKVAKNQLSLFDFSSTENDTTINNGKFPATPQDQKNKEFTEVCSFDLKLIERVTEIKDQLNARASKQGFVIDSLLNFETDGWYFFILSEISEKKTARGKTYLVIKASDATGHTYVRIFNDIDKVKETLKQKNSVYVSQFEKNEKGYINLAKKAPIKVVAQL